MSKPVAALDRRFEMVEAALLDQRGELGAEAAGARRLVDDRRSGRSSSPTASIVSMSSGTMVRRSITSASTPGRLDRGERDMDHRAIGEDGHVLAFAHHRRLAERDGVMALRHLRLPDASPRASPAGRRSRRTGRYRCAWARRRSPDHCPRSPRSAGPWRHRGWTGSPSSRPAIWANSASGDWLWVWPPKMPPP